jgi:hypothetical protein
MCRFACEASGIVLPPDHDAPRVRRPAGGVHSWGCNLNRTPLSTGPSAERGRSSGVEHNLAKVGVEGSNPFARSNFSQIINELHWTVSRIWRDGLLWCPHDVHRGRKPHIWGCVTESVASHGVAPLAAIRVADASGHGYMVLGSIRKIVGLEKSMAAIRDPTSIDAPCPPICDHGAASFDSNHTEPRHMCGNDDYQDQSDAGQLTGKGHDCSLGVR